MKYSKAFEWGLYIMKSKRFLMKALMFLPLFGMVLTGCDRGGSSNSNYPDALDEEPAPEPITINDEGKQDTIFYSDDYFKHRATRYNPHLATLSIYSAKYSMNPGNPDNPEDTNWYNHQSDRLAKFWNVIGFTDSQFNEDYYTRTSFDTIGIGCSQRVIQEGSNTFTVIACTVRSGGYFFEWENNVYLGDGSKSDYMHEGWYNAANRVISFIETYLGYLKTNNLLQTEQIKLWLSGFSRGGAVMNITGGLLDNKLGMDDIETRHHVFEGVSLKREDILVYTFEAPQGANLNSETVEAPRNELYYNIFNIVNQNDLVTKVAMSRYGFTRFGIDKFIVTEFFDPNSISFDRRFVKCLAREYDPDYNWTADDFTTYGIQYSTLLSEPDTVLQVIDWAVSMGQGEFPKVIYNDTNKQNYDANIVLNLLMDRAIDNLGDRQNYCDSFQTFACNLMHYMMADCKDPDALTWQSLAIMVAIQALGYVVLGPAVGLITDLDLSAITGCTSSDVYFALNILGNVFLEYPTEVISIAKGIGDVFHNHDTQLNVFHAQAQDSYYIQWYNHNNQTEQIRLVRYRDNSELVRFECIDINEARIYVNGDGRSCLPSLRRSRRWAMSATLFQTWHIHYTKTSRYARSFSWFDGFAVGIYNYASYHRLEVFVPSFYDFTYHFYDHSWSVWHHVKITRWTYNTNENDNRTGYTVIDDWYNCDSDVFEQNYEKDSEYETDLLSDIGGMTFDFTKNYHKVLSITSANKIDIDVDFFSNDTKYTHLKAVTSGPFNDYIEIYYDDLKVAEGDADRITFIENSYSRIRFDKCDGAKDPWLIKWVLNLMYEAIYK